MVVNNNCHFFEARLVYIPVRRRITIKDCINIVIAIAHFVLCV